MAVKKSKSNLSSGSSLRDHRWTYLAFGVLFGYFLSKARATDFDTIVNMFRLIDYQLYGVLATAIAVISLGLFLMRRKGILTYSGQPMDLETLKWDPRRLAGAFVMGAGWALAGACPGTALAQIGEGKLLAFFTVGGILLGVWAFKKYHPENNSKDQVC